MIDISDGLVQDLGHICQASHIGSVVLAESLPLSPAYRRLAGGRSRDRVALPGAEDYELLFCARRRDRESIDSCRGARKLPSRESAAASQPSKGLPCLTVWAAALIPVGP